MSGRIVAIVVMAVVGVVGVIFARQAACAMRAWLPLFTDKMKSRVSTDYVRAFSATLIVLSLFIGIAVVPHTIS